MSITVRGNPLFFSVPAIGISILCLWANEGRFDFYQAARQAAVIDSPQAAPPEKTVSFTGRLEECRIKCDYVLPFSDYYQVDCVAEIYSWRRSESRRGGVSLSKDWHAHCQENERNSGIKQTLHPKNLFAEKYRVGELEVYPPNLHFADGFARSIPRT